jgi:hypothetical protein
MGVRSNVMRLGLILALVAVVAAGCFGGSSAAPAGALRTLPTAPVIPTRIERKMLDQIGGLGGDRHPRVVGEAGRPAVGAGRARGWIYGVLLRGRFVRPAEPGYEEPSLDAAMVVMDGHGRLLRMAVWDRHNPVQDKNENTVFNRYFGSAPNTPAAD